jgi:hypothetical protein
MKKLQNLLGINPLTTKNTKENTKATKEKKLSDLGTNRLRD